MRKYIVGLLFGILILFPMNTKALLCSNERKVEFSDMAKNISVNYEYVEANDDITFTIKFSGIPEGFLIHDYRNNIDYPYQGSELIIPNAIKNKSYSFQVYVDDVLCEYEVLYTLYITIPSYNKYYKDGLCKGIEEYKLCNKWLNINMSYEEWKMDVNKYKESLIVEEEEPIKEEVKGIFDYIIEFYLDYYYFILPGIVIICFIGIYVYNKKHDLF